MEAVLAIGLLLMLAFVCGAALPAAADVLGSDGLTLTVYNNTGLGAGPGAPEQRTVPGLPSPSRSNAAGHCPPS